MLGGRRDVELGGLWIEGFVKRQAVFERIGLPDLTGFGGVFFGLSIDSIGSALYAFFLSRSFHDVADQPLARVDLVSSIIPESAWAAIEGRLVDGPKRRDERRRGQEECAFSERGSAFSTNQAAANEKLIPTLKESSTPSAPDHEGA